MSEILIFDESWQRVGAQITERYPQVTPVLWQVDGSLQRNGSIVSAAEVAPQAGWVSFDVMRAKLMKPYCEALASFSSMQWIQTLNAGLDHPLYQMLSQHGIRISKSGAQALPIAEYVLGYALFHTQGMQQRQSQQHSKTWKMQRFAELAGSQWLIAGFGHIGKAVAKRARAFDAQIVAVRQSDTQDPLADRTISQAQLIDELPHSDVVVLACPHTPQTDRMVDNQFLSAMKSGSLLINVARGALVDESALMAALDAGTPARAVLDVFDTEPLPTDHALWDHPGVIVTSHTSNAGSGTRERGDQQFLTALGHFLDGSAIPDEVVGEHTR
jgi:phosphoglycerate dehydrogenase-like enzyme